MIFAWNVFLMARSENGLKIDIFWSEIGSRFGEPGETPPPIISRNTSRREAA